MQAFGAIAVLLCITAVLSFVNDRFLGLQASIGLMLQAVIFTLALRIAEAFVPIGAVDLLHGLTQSLNLNDTLLKGVLCFMLFRGSLSVRWANLSEERDLVLGLAFIGTTIACLVTGFLAYAGLTAFGIAITLPQALLFGALIAATDPIAAIGILSKVGLPAKLETVIDGESLLNDGVAVVLFTVFAVAALEGTTTALGEIGLVFVHEVLGGAILGVAGWLVLHLLLVRTGNWHTGLLLSLGIVAGIYATAQQIEVSGPIATVVAGLLAGNLTAPRLDHHVISPLGVFWSGLDEMLNALLFVFVGLHVVLINPLVGVIPGVPGLIAVVAVLAGRALSVGGIVGGLAASGTIHAETFSLTKLLTWAGLRGGLSLALAVSLPDTAWKPLLLNMTFGVVVFSIVVQGLTIARLFDRHQLTAMLR